MSINEINLLKVAETEKEILANLMQYYLYDSSEFNDDDIESSGKLSLSEYFDAYWLEAERHPFFIKHSDKLVGFALVRQIGENQYSIAEFFIVRKYRRLGFGKQAAFSLFDLFQGEWHIAQEERNTKAQTFWKSIIRDYTKGHFQDSFSSGQPEGPKQIFQSRVA